jgi:catechol 2,3-dioxygenase-like lactoylglutathione lyase family enzyme
VRLTGICVITRDVARLRAFYAAALDLLPDGDDTFTLFSAGGASLSLFEAAAMERMAPGSTARAGTGGYTLEFEVPTSDDVDLHHERARSLGAPIVKPPTTQTWGRRSVWFRDPEGNIVNVYTKVPTQTGAATS